MDSYVVWCGLREDIKMMRGRAGRQPGGQKHLGRDDVIRV